jgi:hypothetical protein
MAKIFILIAFALGVSATHAAVPSQSEFLKQNRKALEAQTENRVLEMIETQRLDEEKNRMKKVEEMSFEVLTPSTQSIPTHPEA